MLRSLTALLVVTVMALPSMAAAQMMTITLYGDHSPDGDPSHDIPDISIRTAALPAKVCAATGGYTLDLQINNVPATGSQFDFWFGSNCIDVMARGGGGGVASCNFLGTPSRAITTRPIQYINGISVHDLIVPTAGSPCPTSGTPTYTIYVLDTLVSMSTEAVTTNYGLLTLKIDFDPPVAPAITVGTGETELPVNWTISGDTTDLLEYWIFTDTAVDASCNSSVLTSGMTVPDSATPAGTTSGDSSSFALTGYPLGTRVAIGVAAVDRAGNVGALSNVTCGVFTKTDGFWDRYTADGGSAKSCSVVGAVGSESGSGKSWGALVGVALVGVALALVVRRGSRR